MIKKGTLVKRWSNDYCVLSLGLRYDKLVELYPPECSLCIVTSGPKESDLSTHDRNYNPKSNFIALKKSIEVICERRIVRAIIPNTNQGTCSPVIPDI